MPLTLSMPEGPVEDAPLPMFKSVRRAPMSRADRNAIAQAKVAVQHEPIIELAHQDTWYDRKTPFEMFLDMFWARRNILGEMRSRRGYRTALSWQAAATVPLFPPLGALLVLFNICFGLRPKATRIGFFASVIIAALVGINTVTHSDPILLAALR